MKQRQLGTHGPKVSALGLGCLSFGGMFGPTTEAESLRTLDAAWDAGITFLDTANRYGEGVSETFIGTWLKTTGKRPHIATKAAFSNDPARRIDNRPEHMRAELEGSLKRLGVDNVTLFYAHRRDPQVPAEDLAGTMQRLVTEGKILGYGLSEVGPYTLERCHAVHPVMAVQNEYSLWTRTPELGLIQRCAQLGVAFVPFSPLARGAFGTPMADPTTFQPKEFRTRIPRFHPENWPHNHAKLEAFHAFARQMGFTPRCPRAGVAPRPRDAHPADPRHPHGGAPERLGHGPRDRPHRRRPRGDRPPPPRRLGLGGPLRRPAGRDGGTLFLTVAPVVEIRP